MLSITHLHNVTYLSSMKLAGNCFGVAKAFVWGILKVTCTKETE